MTMINSGTGTGFAEFMERMAKEGRLTSTSADATRSACQMVLSTVHPDDWENLDLTTLDSKDTWERFTVLKGGNYTPGSMSAYKSRFFNGLDMYKQFVKDPTWRPKVKPAPVKKEAKPAVPPAPEDEKGKAGSPKPPEAGKPTLMPPPPPTPGFIDHMYPIRPGVRATLSLPEDLTGREAKRLVGFIQALVIDEQIALPAGPES